MANTDNVALPEPLDAAPARPAYAIPEPSRSRLSPLNQRRWQNFQANRRAFWSLWIFLVLFVTSLFAEFIANDKPILVRYQGGFYMPVFNFYSETTFGGDFRTEAVYADVEVQCLIVTGGLIDCFDDPEGFIEDASDGVINGEEIQRGWLIWPPIPYSYDTIVDTGGAVPSPPSGENLLGTDNTSRDVMARVIYGFRLSVFYALIVTAAASAIGIMAGAAQGYFGGWLDLIFQRIIEIWASTPQLYVIIILFAIFERSFWMLVFISVLFGWTALVGVVRAEFLRARNFEYVCARPRRWASTIGPS
jgi:microcin C transport system permease protein